MFTPNVFPWHSMPNFVIGRTKYDNFIIQSIARDPSQSMIDMSNTGLSALSLLSSGHRPSDDRRRPFGSPQAAQHEEVVSVTHESCNSQPSAFCGTSSSCTSPESTTAVRISGSQSTAVTSSVSAATICHLVPTRTGLCVEAKGVASYMEDDFQVTEMDLLSKYIRPEDKRRECEGRNGR